MTIDQREGTRSVIPTQRDRHTEAPEPAQPPRGANNRPRSVEGEEAYRRSVMEQAKTDIAAGW